MVAPQSGNTVGSAVGRITVDISALIAARDNAVRAGREISETLKGIGPAANQGSRQAESSLQRLEKRLDSIASKGALAMSGLVVGGIKAAQSVEQIDFLFTKLAGSQERATREQAKLRKMADDTNQPFLELQKAAAALFPAIKKSNAELTTTVSIAQRLSILDPAQGIEGAGIAIREFLSGEYMSLVRRFELDRGKLQQIRDDANGNVAAMVDGLDAYISEMGLSQDAMREMGEIGIGAFAAVRDEALLTMAEAFAPLLNDVVLPMVRAFRDLLREVRNTNPELLKTGAAIATIVAATATAKRGVPLLGIPGLPGAANISPTRAVVGAGSLMIGKEIGIEIARRLPFSELRGMSKEDAENRVGDRFKQVVGIIIYGLAQFGKALLVVKVGLETLAAGIVGVLSKVSGTLQFWIAELMNWLDDLPGIRAPKTSDSRLDELRAQRDADIISEEQLNAIRQSFADSSEELDNITKGLFESLGLIDSINLSIRDFVYNTKATIDALFAPKIDFSQEQIDAFTEFQDNLAAIEADAQKQREDALAAHEKSKTETEADYQRDLARMQDDEDRRRARAIQTRDRAISESLSKSAAAEEEIYNKHRDKLADLEKNFRDSSIKEETDHQRKMQRMDRDMLLDRRKAAARLDFQALYELQERQQLQKQDEDSDFDYRQQQRATQYQQQLEAEQIALQQRLAANEDAEQARIQQLKDSFTEQEALQADNHKVELERLADDHKLQLAQMDAQNVERLAQIDAQAKERAALENQAFVDLFNELAAASGQHQDRMLGIQRQGQAQAEAELRAWWSRQNRLLNMGTRGVTTGVSGGGRMGGYQDASVFGVQSNLAGQMSAINTRNAGSSDYDLIYNTFKGLAEYTATQRNTYMGTTRGGRRFGGDIGSSGAYYLERGEAVMTPMVADQMRRMLGGATSQHGMMAAMNGGSRSSNVRIGDFMPTMNFGDIGKYSPQDIMKLVSEATRTELTKILEKFAAP